MKRIQPHVPRRSLALRVLACVFHCLVLASAFQLSGSAAVTLEFGFGALTPADCCSDCPLEKSGVECPPSCPSCHCLHGQIASLPSPSPTLEMKLVASDTRTIEPREAAAPHAPLLRGLYRPPRALRS